MSNSVIFVSIFVLAIISIFLGTGVLYRFILNKVYTKDKNPGEFEQLVALKSAERMKNYYTSILLLVAFILLFLPDELSQKNIGRIIIFGVAFAELADRIFRRKITKSF